MNAIRRLLPRRVVRDQYSFELLRCSSAQDVTASSPHADLPRYYSNYDHVVLQAPPSTTTCQVPLSRCVDVKPSLGDVRLVRVVN
ncbi:hypothetical protein Q1695_001934 [Nippostrongylus brasiliensis]|nr:hypothetical protein Q1695_001934 [Nippostrongylus brasiliensis]